MMLKRGRYLYTSNTRQYLFNVLNANGNKHSFYDETQVNLFAKFITIHNFCFIVIGKFDNVGIATANLDENIGRISTLRLHVHSESDNWAILSEVSKIFAKKLNFC